jgi:hypothetical protein
VRSTRPPNETRNDLGSPPGTPADDPVGDAARLAKAEWAEREAARTDDPERRANLLDLAVRLRETFAQRDQRYREEHRGAPTTGKGGPR